MLKVLLDLLVLFKKGILFFERLVESRLDYLDEDNTEEAKRLSDIIYE